MQLHRQLLIGALGSCMLAAHAASGPDDSAFLHLLSDPAEQQHVIEVAGRSTVFLQNPCADAQFTVEKKVTPYKPLGFDASGNIVSGAWKQFVQEKGCGVTRALNVVVVVQDAGQLGIVPLLPGTTHADPVLQKDAMQYAVQALASVRGGREANCTVGYVADTEYLGEDGEALPGAKGRPWKEMWTLQSCTQKMRVPMQFTPDSTGTSITAGPNKAIEIVPLAR
jgi:hypothetical protein